MDEKTQLINSIKAQMYEELTPEQMQSLDKTLHSQIGEYDVHKRCTKVALTDDSPIRILQIFIATKRMEGLSDSTIKRYYRECSNLLNELQKPLNEINTFDIRAYLLNCQRKGTMSNRTLDGMRLCYSSFFGWCYQENFIASNPCQSVGQIKYEKKVKTPFTDTEMELIKRECRTKRNRALVEFLYATGCRVSEIEQLNRNDIDFETKTAIVHGKGNKERVVYITNVAIMYLKEYLAERDDDYPALFIGKGTERLSKNGIEKILQRIGGKAGVNNVYPHRYRRTLATNLIDRGVGIQYVAKVLGHEDIDTTQIYCYTNQQNVANEYKKFIS